MLLVAARRHSRVKPLEAASRLPPSSAGLTPMTDPDSRGPLVLTRILVALPAADADLAGLVERGYLRERPAPVRATFDGKAVRGRGPTPAYLVNPLAAAAPRGSTPFDRG